MIITNCPRCGAMNVTTTCNKCGWSQFTKSTVSTGVYNTIGEIEIMLSGKALSDDYKRLLLENRNLKERVAELEAGQRWRIIADGEMPEDRATVLVAFTEYPEQIDILTATYYKRYEGFGGVDNWWNIEGWHSGNVTHWMPQPQPPEAQQ